MMKSGPDPLSIRNGARWSRYHRVKEVVTAAAPRDVRNGLSFAGVTASTR
jgi:hypothetical protein